MIGKRRPHRKQQHTQEASPASSRKEQERFGKPSLRNAKTLWAEKALPIVRRALFPPTAIIACSIPAICIMMAWVFLLGNENSPLSYAAYAASAYLFAAFTIWAARNVSRSGIRKLTARNTLVERLLNDTQHRRATSTAGSLAIDAAWALANLAGGVYSASVWLITLGCYYLVFAIMRGALLSRMRRRDKRESPANESGIERLCGVLLLAMTFVLSGIVCLVMRGEGTFTYGDLAIYAVALFAFYSLISAIVSYARQRKRGDALVILTCRINLAVALVSIFTLEVAMLAEFGTDTDATFAYVTPIITGAAIAAALIAMGVRSITDARKANARHR